MKNNDEVKMIQERLSSVPMPHPMMFEHQLYLRESNNWLKFHGKRMRRKPFKKEKSIFIDEFDKYMQNSQKIFESLNEECLAETGMTLHEAFRVLKDTRKDECEQN